MHTRILAAFLAVGLVVLSPSAFGERAPLKFDAIRAQQAEIRIGVTSRSGIYAGLSQTDRDMLLSKQTQMLDIIGDKQTADELNEHQKGEVANTLEWIEALVNKADDERMICERRATLGSNRKERVCRTAVQVRQDRETARSALGDGNVCRDCRSQ